MTQAKKQIEELIEYSFNGGLSGKKPFMQLLFYGSQYPDA